MSFYFHDYWGLLDKNGVIENDETIFRLWEIVFILIKHGAD